MRRVLYSTFLLSSQPSPSQNLDYLLVRLLELLIRAATFATDLHFAHLFNIYIRISSFAATLRHGFAFALLFNTFIQRI